MKALQASTSYSFGISSFPNLPGRPRNQQCVIRAKAEPSEKSVEIMRKFSEQYARKSGTYFCADKSVTSVVIKGLAEHKDTLGAPLCPCRHYDDKAAEAGQGFWNCPCVPMRERNPTKLSCWNIVLFAEDYCYIAEFLWRKLFDAGGGGGQLVLNCSVFDDWMEVEREEIC